MLRYGEEQLKVHKKVCAARPRPARQRGDHGGWKDPRTSGAFEPLQLLACVPLRIQLIPQRQTESYRPEPCLMSDTILDQRSANYGPPTKSSLVLYSLRAENGFYILFF